MRYVTVKAHKRKGKVVKASKRYINSNKEFADLYDKTVMRKGKGAALNEYLKKKEPSGREDDPIGKLKPNQNINRTNGEDLMYIRKHPVHGHIAMDGKGQIHKITGVKKYPNLVTTHYKTRLLNNTEKKQKAPQPTYPLSSYKPVPAKGKGSRPGASKKSKALKQLYK